MQNFVRNNGNFGSDLTRHFVWVGWLMFVPLISAAASIRDPLSQLSATMQEPVNLAQAAGRYLGAVEQLNVLKATRCAYAFKRQVPNFDKVVSDEILPAFSPQSRDEMATAIKGLKPDMTRQGQTLFTDLYDYYTKKEQLDNNTTCGFIASSFITLRKLTADSFERKSKLP